ncbi:MAG: DUF4870 domain-containing protein [Bryobacteraceae bacterium]|nr:DUF4870 domain-containing protein [Bryobacteraceae bacterium]
MAFCSNCGASVEGAFCVRCGTQAAPASAAGSHPPQSNPGYTPGYTTGSVPPDPSAAGLTDNVAGALCYAVGLITGIIFLVLAPYNQSKFVRFHAFQAIFFHCAFIGTYIVETMVFIALPYGVQVIASLLWMVIWLGTLALWILLMIKAYQGEVFKLPVIGDLAAKQA